VLGGAKQVGGDSVDRAMDKIRNPQFAIPNSPSAIRNSISPIVLYWLPYRAYRRIQLWIESEGTKNGIIGSSKVA